MVILHFTQKVYGGGGEPTSSTDKIIILFIPTPLHLSFVLSLYIYLSLSLSSTSLFRFSSSLTMAFVTRVYIPETLAEPTPHNVLTTGWPICPLIQPPPPRRQTGGRKQNSRGEDAAECLFFFFIFFSDVSLSLSHLHRRMRPIAYRSYAIDQQLL